MNKQEQTNRIKQTMNLNEKLEDIQGKPLYHKTSTIGGLDKVYLNSPIQFSLKVSRGKTENGKELNFAISSGNKSTDPVTNITSNSSVQLSAETSFPISVFSGDTMNIGMDFIRSGRLYFGYGELPVNNVGKIAPKPEGGQYYGWIEFSRLSTDTCVWINLSNVDIIGLPVALSSSTWSLGYKTSIETIKNDVKNLYPSAAITADTHTVIVGPNVNYKPYPSYESYLNGLYSSGASLCINSDTLSDGTQKQFSGKFVSTPDKHIYLESNSGDTFVLSGSEFTDKIIYGGDGGTLVYNGVVVAQNQDGNSDSVISSNSVFRNLIIGLNEGYFESYPEYSDGINYSLNYSFLKPFGENGNMGSMYAKIIHENSNSYGFAYSDSNLKTLIQSEIGQVIEIYVLADDESGSCYVDNGKSNTNSPSFGSLQFGIGGSSNKLGDISIGNCNYPPTSNGSYGGYLPYVDSWQKMQFGSNGYIWINCVKMEVIDYYMDGGVQKFCLSGRPVVNPVSNPPGSALIWGADISWIGSQNADNPPQNVKSVCQRFVENFKRLIRIIKTR